MPLGAVSAYDRDHLFIKDALAERAVTTLRRAAADGGLTQYPESVKAPAPVAARPARLLDPGLAGRATMSPMRVGLIGACVFLLALGAFAQERGEYLFPDRPGNLRLHRGIVPRHSIPGVLRTGAESYSRRPGGVAALGVS